MKELRTNQTKGKSATAAPMNKTAYMKTRQIAFRADIL